MYLPECILYLHAYIYIRSVRQRFIWPLCTLCGSVRWCMTNELNVQRISIFFFFLQRMKMFCSSFSAISPLQLFSYCKCMRILNLLQVWYVFSGIHFSRASHEQTRMNNKQKGTNDTVFGYALLIKNMGGLPIGPGGPGGPRSPGSPWMGKNEQIANENFIFFKLCSSSRWWGGVGWTCCGFAKRNVLLRQ